MTSTTVHKKPVRELAVGDTVHGIGNTTFTEPHIVTSTTDHWAKATGRCWWPFNMLGDQQAVVA